MSKENYSEAPATCNSQGSLSNKSRIGNIDMNIVAKTDLNFHGIALQPAPNVNGIWLTSADIAKALGYASSKSVSTIYSRNSDEFTDSMSMVIKMMTNGINNNLREKSVRVFSLRGCHLVAMFATTDKAKEFRRWVLDILDREGAHSPIAKQFTDEELCSLAYLWRSAAVMYEACKEVYPLLLVADHKLLPRFCSIGTNYNRGINKARVLLKRETGHIKDHPWGDSNWKNVLSYGKEILQ